MILVMCCCGLVSTFRVAENVVFERVQEIQIVRANWLFSYFTDLQAYQTYLERLKGHIEKTKQQVTITIRTSRESNRLDFLNLYQGQLKEVESLEEMFTVVSQDLTDVLELQASRTTRVKRALLPFVGKALSFLFGTVSQSDLESVYKQIDILGDNQQEIIHVVNSTLSILNVTSIEVKKNRHAIQSITKQMYDLGITLGRQTMELRRIMKGMYEFLLTYLQLDLMITELRESLERGMFYMDNVKITLDQLSLGKVPPTGIHPAELKQILTEIQAKIPNYLTLPAPIEDIWYYYKTLTCITLVKDNRFITLVNIPLLEMKSQFQIYRVHNIPLPYSRAETKMSAQYELETEVLAISATQTEFVLMQPMDLASCTQPSTKFCKLSSPVYKTSDSSLCVISLYKQDQVAVNRNCKSRVQFDTRFPQAVYISDGNWVIINDNPMTLTVMCLKDKTYQINTQPPVHTIQLAAGCEAYSDKITLPPYYHQESQYGTIEQRNVLLTLRDSSNFDLWKPVQRILENDSTLALDLPDLDSIDDVNVQDLVDKLYKLKGPDKLNKKTFWDYLEYVGTPLVLLCILLTLGVLWYAKPRVKICNAMAKIRGAGTALKTGNEEVEMENFSPSAESTESQSREGAADDQKAKAAGSRGYTLELKNV